ncbi:alpha-ketoglutarate-dependent dioxygenase AlkB family protein [Streptomyces sp. NPDC087300]|uniref:alpha-ketoglutarate-dependent dioxygenase AlkB family protein n=1 Tax=Streptomyces sp. NPDC087300 TaxID=3365780 RepID=UPI0037FD0184
MGEELFPRDARALGPGAVHVPDWLGSEAQRELVEACRGWARPPAGLRVVRTPGGGTMTARQVGLGWHWFPYGYARSAVDGDGAPVKPLPEWLAALGRTAVGAARAAAGSTGAGSGDAHGDPYGDEYTYDYDIALINLYDGDARMGMHRDGDEKSGAPVVSLSLGDTCVFRFGNPLTRTKPYTDVELRSGDLVVFGGASRLAYHGVPRVLPGTAPPGLGLTGRLNITLRVSGLVDGGPPGDSGVVEDDPQ